MPEQLRDKHRQTRSLLATAALALLAHAAHAHDTWFEPQPGRVADAQPVLALGTGTRFPRQEFTVPRHQVQASGCVVRGGREVALQHVADEPTLWLRPAAPGPLSCWTRLVPLELEIDDATVEIYLDEVRAVPAVRERWAALRARGVRWHETYVKHTRIELGDTQLGAGAMPAAPGLGVDALLETRSRPLRAGDTLRAQVLRQGRPLAGLPVELQSDLSPLGLWRVTDAEGRIEVTLPLAARWLLRGVELRPSTTRADRWESDFISLAFEVLPAVK